MKEENNNWLLYVLYDKNKLEEGVRYVGITSTSIQKRIHHHFDDAKRHQHNHISRLDWLRSMSRETLGYQIIKKGMNKDEAGEFEKQVIYVHKELGYNLLNSTDGGFGGGNKGKKLSEEARKRMSKSRIGNKNHFYGKTHSDETKRKLSETNKCISDEHRKRISEANKGKKISDEHRKKISEAMKGEKNHNYGRKLSDETRKKLSESKKGRTAHNKGKSGKPLSDKHKKIISERMKGRIVSEETKLKMAQARKQYWINRKPQQLTNTEQSLISQG